MLGKIMKSRYIDYKVIKKHIRALRKNQTKAEETLWHKLRSRKLSGYKFLRQHPIVYKADYKGLNYFIADFYCDEKKAVIELDGQIHDENHDYDNFRDSVMKEMRIRVLRIKNEDLENLDEVLSRIITFLNSIS
jgi:very-short-patch-repair endonuclease